MYYLQKYILHDYRRRLMEVLVIASLTSWMTFTVSPLRLSPSPSKLTHMSFLHLNRYR